MMLRIYYCSPIDICLEKAKEEIEKFKQLFSKFPNIQVEGAGFGDNPIVDSNTSWIKKKAIVSYDYRILRSCDILLVITDLKTFCSGTMLEMEYARQLGLTIILYCPYKPKNIFLECLTDKIVYSIEELEEVLRELNE